MTGIIKKAVLGLTLGATALSVAAPADAQRYRGDYRHGRGISPGGAAVIGGIVGLGLGAAIASNNRDRYYDRGYYDRGYYDAPRTYYYDRAPRTYYRERYYAPPPPPRYYYRDGYYGRPYRGYYGY